MSNNWNVVPFTEAVDICDTFRKPINSSERASRIKGKEQSELYPYYGATGQVGFIDDYITDGEYVLLGEDGAPFLDAFSKKAYIISGKTWVNNHAHVLRFKCMSTQRYVEYYFAGLKLDEYITGAAQPKLTQKALNSIIISIPSSLAEQSSIVSHLDSLSSTIRKLEELQQKTLAECDALKQAMLREVFE